MQSSEVAKRFVRDRPDRSRNSKDFGFAILDFGLQIGGLGFWIGAFGFAISD